MPFIFDGSTPAGEIGQGMNDYSRQQAALATARREGLPSISSPTGQPITGPGASFYRNDVLRNTGIDPTAVALGGGLDSYLTRYLGPNWQTALSAGRGRPGQNRQGLPGGAGGAAGLGGVGASLGNTRGQFGLSNLGRSMLSGGFSLGPFSILGLLGLGPISQVAGLYSALQTHLGPFNAVRDFSGPHGLYGKPQVGTPGFGLSTGAYGSLSRNDPGGRPSF